MCVHLVVCLFVFIMHFKVYTSTKMNSCITYFYDRFQQKDSIDSCVRGLQFLMNPASQLTEHNHLSAKLTNKTSDENDVTKDRTSQQPEQGDVTHDSTNQQSECRDTTLGPSIEFTEDKFMSEDELQEVITRRETFMKTSVPHIRLGSAWHMSDEAFEDHKRFLHESRNKSKAESCEEKYLYPALLLILEDDVTCVKVCYFPFSYICPSAHL